MNVPDVYVRVSYRGLRRPALAVATLVVAALLTATGAARADTTFGGDPTQALNRTLTCQAGVHPSNVGAPSCLWTWISRSAGGDAVPFPTIGGSGTITGVTLPAMPNPGPMQAVVLTRSVTAGSIRSEPSYACCQVKSISPIFTVPADRIATVPLDLRVAATEAANLSEPGDTSSADSVALSVLSPTASLPLLYTGSTSSSIDGNLTYFPAPTATSSEFVQPTSTLGYQLLARFSYEPSPRSAGAGPGKATSGPSAAGGVKVSGRVFRPTANGKTLILGRVLNPPAVSTKQTLTNGGAHASAAAAKVKPILGNGKTTVPSGKSAPLKLTLNSKARAKLAKGHNLKATLTIVATNAQGESQTVARTVTVKPAQLAKK